MDGLAKHLWGLDWQNLFVPDMSVLEATVRLSVVYLALYFLFRVVLKREAGSVSITDLLVLVLVADASQNAMADQYDSITDGLILAVVLVFWAWALDFASYRWRRARQILRPAPLILIRDGQILWPNLRKELITEEELIGQLRSQGVARAEDVAYCFMETDGRFSVIPKEQDTKTGRSERRDVT